MKNVLAILGQSFLCHCRTLWGLSKMTVMNVLVLLDLKILQNLVFVQKSLLENNADVRKISQSVQADIAFISNVLSEIVISLNLFFLEIKNVISFIKALFYWRQGCIIIRNYLENLEYNCWYHEVYKDFTQISQCRKLVYVVAYLRANNINTRHDWCHAFLMKSNANTCFMDFHVAQVKYVNFLHRLIYHTAAAHACASPQPSWFIIGTISTLSYLVFIWVRFKKRN